MKKSDFDSAIEIIKESYPSVVDFINKIIKKNESLTEVNNKLKLENDQLRRSVEMYYSFISGGNKDYV